MRPHPRLGLPTTGGIAVIFLLAACESNARNSAPPASAEPQPEPPVPAAPAESASGEPDSADPRWTISVSNAGAAIVLNTADGEEFRIVCGREPAILAVDVPGFTSIGSEERLSFGLDDEPYIFVAQVTPPPPAGVHAEREVDEAFLEALSRARTVSAVYGAQTSGPHIAPDSATATEFRDACLEAFEG